MKRIISFFAALLLTALSVSAQTAYVAIDPSTNVMTFRYDNRRTTLQRMGNTIYTLNADGQAPDWYSDSNREKIVKVVFDSSFAAARPTTTHRWFHCLYGLERIEGMENLNTSEVTDMSYMFAFCDKLKGLDVSGFNTSKVTTMEALFYQCKSLTTLDVSSFNTSKVTKMNYMFSGCEGVMNLDVTGFNTSKVTDMASMFSGCESLTTLDVSGFDVSKVTEMRSMFLACTDLKTIYCNNNWSCESSMSMFNQCYKLEGAVKYNSTKTDVSMANPTTGYFTSRTVYGIWCKDNSTLYFDVSSAEIKAGSTYQGQTVTSVISFASNGDNIKYWKVHFTNQVEIVRFMPSFKTVQPTDLSSMFIECRDLEKIIDIKYLNTSKVENMGSMFHSCMSLTNLDLSSFDTSNVKSMTLMFYECRSLTSLNVSHFNTSNVKNMVSMFSGCSELTNLDLSSFNTSNVTGMIDMFSLCSSLETIYCNDSWSCENSGSMFSACYSLEGAVKYDSSKNDASMANPDTGYFTRNRYDLWLGGVQVTIANKDNIPVGKGKASYDPKTKTLTLKDVYLENGSGDYCIKSEVDGLTIKLLGTNKLISTKTGISLVNSAQTRQRVRITGPGKLEIEASQMGINFALYDLEVIDCEELTVNSNSGLVGSMSFLFAALNPDNVPEQDFERLIIFNSNVTVNGATIVTKFILDDNTVYMEEPAGGYFKFPYVYDTSGEPAPTIVIKKKGDIPGDVNEDGDVNINDVVAIINVMAGTATWPNADVNSDKAVNINDVVAVINIMASK